MTNYLTNYVYVATNICFVSTPITVSDQVGYFMNGFYAGLDVAVPLFSVMAIIAAFRPRGFGFRKG